MSAPSGETWAAAELRRRKEVHARGFGGVQLGIDVGSGGGAQGSLADVPVVCVFCARYALRSVPATTEVRGAPSCAGHAGVPVLGDRVRVNDRTGRVVQVLPDGALMVTVSGLGPALRVMPQSVVVLSE